MLSGGTEKDQQRFSIFRQGFDRAVVFGAAVGYNNWLDDALDVGPYRQPQTNARSNSSAKSTKTPIAAEESSAVRYGDADQFRKTDRQRRCKDAITHNSEAAFLVINAW
jgi:hypothetical protein